MNKDINDLLKKYYSISQKISGVFVILVALLLLPAVFTGNETMPIKVIVLIFIFDALVLGVYLFTNPGRKEKLERERKENITPRAQRYNARVAAKQSRMEAKCHRYSTLFKMFYLRNLMRRLIPLLICFSFFTPLLMVDTGWKILCVIGGILMLFLISNLIGLPYLKLKKRIALRGVDFEDAKADFHEGITFFCKGRMFTVGQKYTYYSKDKTSVFIRNEDISNIQTSMHSTNIRVNGVTVGEPTECKIKAVEQEPHTGVYTMHTFYCPMHSEAIIMDEYRSILPPEAFMTENSPIPFDSIFDLLN